MTATARNRSAKLAQIQETSDRQDLERQMTRKWKIGDVYAPHDLSGVEMSKWKQIQQKGRPKRDVFDILRLNPLEHYKACGCRDWRLGIWTGHTNYWLAELCYHVRIRDGYG